MQCYSAMLQYTENTSYFNVEKWQPITDENDHFSATGRLLVESVDVGQILGQMTPETVDFDGIIRLQPLVSDPPKVLQLPTSKMNSMKCDETEKKNEKKMNTLPLKMNNSRRIIEMAS